MVINIARKELKSMFASPMGWIILGVMQLAIGSYFTLSFNQYFEIINLQGQLPMQIGMTQFMCEGIFDTASVLLLFIIPLISMRMISDELKNKTMTFLISAPISVTDIICGKFLALVIYNSILIFVMVAMMLCLRVWVELDYGLMLLNATGIWLLMSALSALGLFFSSQTQYAVIAGFLTFLTSAFLILMDKWIGASNQLSLVSQLSIMHHYRNFSHGLLSSNALVFFTLFTAFFVLMAIHRLYINRMIGH